MRIGILKFVLFSIIICSFEYGRNELYYVNERIIYFERNVINFINNRILANVDNQFDLNNFYESTLSLANQFSDYIGDDEITNLRNSIDSHIKEHKENNTLPNLNNVDKKTRRLIHELQKELEEVKKELDNKRNSEFAIQPIQDKKITKKDENISVSEHEDFKQLENCENILKSKYDFESEYNEITSSNSYKEIKVDKNMNKTWDKLIMNGIMILVGCFMIALLGAYNSNNEI
ncbi:fam-b protein [Plasmodium vinckei]|uniref:Fam-b protein n=1 Tax=Plasmodium vinckei TaxID=5860 RepID=A0A6V7SHJ3_PLAVN|nr:fam-b protein [Plasmodium vinckei]